MADASVRVTLTLKAPCTALSNVTVKSRPLPSAALMSSTVTWALSLSLMMPAAVSVSVTSALVEDRLTVKVSVPSRTASSNVATVNCCVSPAVPAKLRAATTLS